MKNERTSKESRNTRRLVFIPLAVILLACISTQAVAQDTKHTPVRVGDKNALFEVVEQMPEYPGGIDALMTFIKDNLRYPVEAQKAGEQGRVIIQFVVQPDGSTDNFNIARGQSTLLASEAIRILAKMPAWKPGMQKGETVAVKYTIPIVFTLGKDGNKPVDKIDETIVVSYTNSKDAGDEKEPVFVIVEKMPQYPGGSESLMKYLAQNAHYPVSAQKDKKEGRVVVQFMVDKEGNIRDPKVVRGISPDLDAEAIRLVVNMPKWEPGMQKGEAVNVTYNVPIMFKLEAKPFPAK